MSMAGHVVMMVTPRVVCDKLVVRAVKRWERRLGPRAQR